MSGRTVTDLGLCCLRLQSDHQTKEDKRQKQPDLDEQAEQRDVNDVRQTEEPEQKQKLPAATIVGQDKQDYSHGSDKVESIYVRYLKHFLPD